MNFDIMKIARLSKSSRKGKRFTVLYDGRTIHFGSDVGSTFIDHGDEKKKLAWIARHKKANGDKFDDFTTSMGWANWLLWNQPTLKASIKDIAEEFGILVRMSYS
jgi:hypothetical protein